MPDFTSAITGRRSATVAVVGSLLMVAALALVPQNDDLNLVSGDPAQSTDERSQGRCQSRTAACADGRWDDLSSRTHHF